MCNEIEVSGYYLISNKYNFIFAQNIRAASKSIKANYQNKVFLENYFLKFHARLSNNKFVKPIPKAHASLNFIKKYIGSKKFNKYNKIFVARDTVSWIRSIIISLANGNKEIVKSKYENLDTIDNILNKIKFLETTITQSQFIYDLEGNLICDFCLDFSKLDVGLNTIGKKIFFQFNNLKNIDKKKINYLKNQNLILNKMKISNETLKLCKDIWKDDYINFNNFKSENNGLIKNKIRSNTSSILKDKIYQQDPYLYLKNTIEHLIFK